MSCGRDPTDEPSFPPIEPAAALCVRCKLLSPTILIRSTSYCSECFLDVIRTRFLSGLSSARDRARKGSAREVQERKPRAASTRSSVLLAFSGGASSRALLNLIRTSFPVVHAKQNARFTPPPTFQKFEVVYVDESGVPGYGGVDRTEEVRQIVESTGFAFVGIKLEDAFDEVSVPPATSSCSQPSTPLSSLQSFLFGHTATSRTSLHASLLQSLLRRTAVARGHEILFTGESASRVAVKVLGGMSEGRGWGMGEEVGSAFEVDFEAEGISLFHSRPLSLCLDKEIVLYNRLSNLQSLTMVTPATGVGAKQAGVEALCEEFVNGLEAAFPATVSTIIRTAGKLGLRSSHELAREGVEDPAARSGGECPLCGLPSQAGGSEWRRANTISSLVDSRALAAGNDTAEPTSHPTDPAPAALLCYGCLIIFEEQQSAKRPSAARSIAGEAGLVTPVVLLPPYALEVARRRGQMREQIDEFLLE